MASSSVRVSGHRTLADQLRGWPDARLSRLLRERPDLASPAPSDSRQLASRATTRSSLLRALDQLNRLELTVLDALVVAGQTTQPQLAAISNATRASVDAALTRLVDLALAWEATGGLRPLSGVAEGLAGVSGLRPVSGEQRTTADVDRLLAEVSPEARALLRHVDAHGGEATSAGARHTVTPGEATGPAEELLSRRLLVPRGRTLVQLPGEVGIALRGGHTTRDPVDVPPALATSSRDSALVDRAAAGTALETVRRVRLLLDHWGTTPPRALRTGALGVRDLKEAAAVLHVSERQAALLAEVAVEAGLVTRWADREGNPAWTPTDAYDAWSLRPPAEQWVALVTAWLESARVPALVGGHDSGGKTRNALDPELASVFAAETRRMALAVLTELAAGEVLASGTGVPSVVARVAWERPRRPRSRADQAAWALDEAADLGLVALGGLATHGRSLLAGENAATALAPLLPPEVDHVLIQADLTAVAPGPLAADQARGLGLLADVESRGGATVYRFAPTSLRRAFDAGWSAAEVHAFVASVSRTSVPQALSYLVDDVARTFGTLRVGHAEAFLRTDDEAALSELLHDSRAASWGLRRLAPTVVVSTSPVDVLLPRLRELGLAPVVEAADGSVHVSRRDQLRASPPRPRRTPSEAARTEARLGQVVTAIRAGDRVAASRPTAASSLTPSGSLAALREAVEGGRTVLIGYVDNHGTSSERIVDPVKVEGGWLTGRDQRADDVRSFAVHRITSVKPLDLAP
ncbi:MAG: helicase-associated domain-containing protein [Nocardioides sp.]